MSIHSYHVADFNFWPLRAKVTSSTKPEAHSISQRHQRKVESRPTISNMTKISEICSRQTQRHAQTDIRITITVTVTVTESFVRRRLLGDRGRITQQSSVGIPVSVVRLEQECFRLTTESSGRLQQLQLCRQRVPCSRCGDRESRVADPSACPRHDEVARRRDTQCRSSEYIGN